MFLILAINRRALVEMDQRRRHALEEREILRREMKNLMNFYKKKIEALEIDVACK